MNQEYKIPPSGEVLNTQASSGPSERYYLDNIDLVREVQSSIKQMRDRMLDTYYVSPSEANANKFLNPVRRLIGTEVKPTELALTESMLLDREGMIGGSLFKESLPGVDCRFFYTDQGSWFFYQTAKSDQADGSFRTTRYQVTGSSIAKVVGARLVSLDIVEFNNFVHSVQDYHFLVSNNLYQDQQV